MNSGQSPSSLFIKNYISNIGYRYKYNFICFLLSQFDNLGLLLYKLKCIRIVERIFIFIIIEKIYLLPLFKIIKFKNIILNLTYLIVKKNKTIFNGLKVIPLR